MNGGTQARIADALLGLDRWLETTRVDWPGPGYGGPVVHWWNHCRAYTGTGLDWRYEGIVAGYLSLWRKSGDQAWLDKAIRAGRDLLEGQLPDGHFVNSRFELNPGAGGTPHEAAADIALLLLARELEAADPELSASFLKAAERNLESYWFGRLWHAPSATLWDSSSVPSFVPNKAATFLEAVLLLATRTGRSDLIGRYVVPTGEHILAMQVRSSGTVLNGAIAQNRFGDRIVPAYFPLYIARCIPPLLRLFEATDDPRFRDGALAAAWFLMRVREPDGGFPQVLYGNGKRNRHPRWIAGAGDLVRALREVNGYGAETEIDSTVRWMLRGVRPDGRIAAAEGFGRIMPLISRRDRFADELGVAGWCDKAFRVLALILELSPIPASKEARTRRSVTRAAMTANSGSR